MSNACEYNPEMFLSSFKEDVREAKAQCLRCPVIAKCLYDCLDYEALSGEFMVGTIGGTTQQERRAAAEIRRSA